MRSNLYINAAPCTTASGYVSLPLRIFVNSKAQSRCTACVLFLLSLTLVVFFYEIIDCKLLLTSGWEN
jgi:hypothetical protein